MADIEKLKRFYTENSNLHFAAGSKEGIERMWSMGRAFWPLYRSV
jgi:hypothetical protein